MKIYFQFGYDYYKLFKKKHVKLLAYQTISFKQFSILAKRTKLISKHSKEFKRNEFHTTNYLTFVN